MMLGNMSNSFDDDMKRLQEASEAAVARMERIRRAGGEAPTQGRPVREVLNVTPEEYSIRLRNSLRKDAHLVKGVKEERIVSSLAEWKARVGPTFANAHTDRPVILERVARLGDPDAKHKTSLLMAGNIGVGKAQPLNEPVLLPNGTYKPMGKVVPGDELVGSQGRPVTVLSVHPQGERQAYLVSFSDGVKTYCDLEHLWTVKHISDAVWKTVTTGELMMLDDLEDYEIPLTRPVEYSSQEYFVQPYVLGFLISARRPNKDEAPFPLSSSTGDDLYGHLNKMGLLGVSYESLKVPGIYARGNVEQRMQFLNGVFDSAGYINSRQRIAVSTRSSSLKKILIKIVHSLGGTVRVKEKHGLHTLIPDLPSEFHLFTVKSDYYSRECSLSKSMPYRRFRKIRKAFRTGMQCVSVDSDDNLYLTRNFIVTHNTWHAYAYLNHAIQAGKVTAGQIVAGSELNLLGHISRAGFKAEEKWDYLFLPRHQIYFIDDVGKSQFTTSEARQGAWYALIDHIYTHQLAVIITTNKSVNRSGSDSLGQWLGDAAFDRLVTMVGSDGMFIPGKMNKRQQVLEDRESLLRERQQGPAPGTQPGQGYGPGTHDQYPAQGPGPGYGQ